MSAELKVREAPARYLVERALIPVGYKQTEVGVIPEDWEVVQFGEITTPRKQRVDPKRGEAYEFCVELEHIGSGAGTLLGYASTNEQSSLKSVFRTDDVLFGKLRAYLRKYWLANREGVCSTEIWVLSPTGRLASSAYLFQLVQTDNFVEAASSSYGTHMPRSDWSVVRNYVLPLPPTKAEQEAIAEALSDADALIGSLERLIAKKRKLKQGAMQELLTGKKRLPGFGGVWEVKRLDAVADIRSGGTPSTHQPQFWDGEILWCTPTDITELNGSKYLMQTSRTITQQGLKASSAELIPVNSVVMTSRATIGECAINAVPVATNQGFKNFVPFDDTDGEYLYYLLQTKKQTFISLCGGSTFLEIGKVQLAAVEIELPKEKEEQTAIAAVLSDMDAEIAALEARLAKARAVKQGMMQELLTGRIRLV